MASAERLDLAQLDKGLVEQALSSWRLGVPAAISSDLLAWWDAYSPERDRWEVALAALASIVGGS